VVLHVHDEIVIETDKPEDVKSSLGAIMSTSPTWASDLPLAAEVKIMSRYGK
jgi:DNA polymerase I-like protein with 3'-5' exonuclease and polymerase domains